MGINFAIGSGGVGGAGGAEGGVGGIGGAGGKFEFLIPRIYCTS